MSPPDGFGDVPAELVDAAGGKPHAFAPVVAAAPAGHVPAAAGAVREEPRATAAAPRHALNAGLSPGEDLSSTVPTEILIRPAVSVVVCAFTEERWDDLRRVLGSLRTQTEPPGEVILVIDHCPALLRRARVAYPDVTIVPNHFQKGLAGGRNTGVAHAWGDVVAFIDDDAFADPEWLARLADHYMDPSVLGVGGLVEPAWEHKRPGWFPPELDWVVGCSYLGMRSGLGPVRNFIGANMSFRREILAEIGGFSIELGRVDSNPFGCEETELCLRVSQRYPDAILLYEPAAAVHHRVRKQRARWRYLRSRCYAEGRSKATVASLAGAESALASERSYVRSTIPRGIFRSLWKAARGRPTGLLSAYALVMAVLMTGFGYYVGRRSGRKNAGQVLVAEDPGAGVLDAEAWVLESERAVPDEQTWVLDADDWVPAVDDWAPDPGGPRALNGGRHAAAEPGAARPGTAVPGSGTSSAPEAEAPPPAAPPARHRAPAPPPVEDPQPAVAWTAMPVPPRPEADAPTVPRRSASAPTVPAPPRRRPPTHAAPPDAAPPEVARPRPRARPQAADRDFGTKAGSAPLEVAWWDEPLPPAEPVRDRRARIGAAVRVADLALPWACLAAVAGLWAFGLSRVQAGRVATAGLGLVSVLPVAFWAAAAVLMLSFCLTVVRTPGRWPVLGAHLVILAVILHATPAAVYGTLRYSWAWKHVGVVDYIIHHGIDFNLGGVLGVYQGWPGFFALNAFLTTGGGLQSALSYAPWALVANDLLWLGPVLLIARAFTADWRMIWIAAWVFELGNWVGQDYFSPQAFAFFLFLTVIAICLRWLGDDRPPRHWVRAALARVPGLPDWVRGRVRLSDAVRALWHPARAGRPLGRAPGHKLWQRTGIHRLWRGPAGDSVPVAGAARADGADAALPAEGAGVSRSTRLVLVAALVPLMAAIASSHQLTPIMVVIALTTLAVFRHLRPRVLLPLLALVIAAGWIGYGGLSWLQANSSQIWSGFGALWANSSAHIVGGSQVPPDQIIVEWGARLLSAAIGLAAVAGFWRFRRHRGKAARRSWNRVALLGVASIPMVAGNSYGGEIIFRAFLFALPFMAVAAAALFFPRPRPRRRYLAGAALAVTTLLLAAGFFLSNYGTDAMNYFTPQEVTASQWLYRTAPAGAQVIAVNSNFPWAFVHYNRYSYTFLDGTGYTSDVLRNPVQEITYLMSPPYPRVSYLVLTQSQAAQEAISGPWSPNDYPRVYGALTRSSAFTTVYVAKGVTILELSHHAAPPPVRPAHHTPRPARTVTHKHRARPNRLARRRAAARARYFFHHHPPGVAGHLRP